MPEQTFGRTIKNRRSELGLSQGKLGELVGRSASSVRSWERDKSHPSEQSIVTALSAVLGIDEAELFELSGQQAPEVETSPTIEQALATLNPATIEEELAAAIQEPLPAPETPQPAVRQAAYVAPPPPYSVGSAIPPAHEPSYMEDRSQRQLYRVRNLATIVVMVALGITLLWAFAEGFGALGDWWDEFFGNLRL